MFLGEVLGEKASVGVAVIAPDHHEAVQPELFAVLERGFELGGGFDFVSARADHVETAAVAEGIDVRFFEFSEIVFIDAFRAIEETVQDGFGVDGGDVVVEADDDIVATRCLAAAEHTADLDGLFGGVEGGGEKIHLLDRLGHVREERFDFGQGIDRLEPVGEGGALKILRKLTWNGVAVFLKRKLIHL